MQHFLDTSTSIQNGISQNLPGHGSGVRHVGHADAVPVLPQRHEGLQAGNLIGGGLHADPASPSSP